MQQQWQLASHAVLVPHEAHGTLIDCSCDQRFHCNHSAKSLLLQLQQGCSTAALLQTLQQLGKASRAQQQQDLNQFLGQLHQQGLIHACQTA